MRRARRPFAPLALAVLVTTLATAHAVVYESAFLPLRTELVARRDGGLAGAVTKDAQKQLRAVTKAVKAIDAPAGDFADDARTGAKVEALLRRPFAEELAAPAGALRALLSDLATALDARGFEENAALSARAGVLPGSVARSIGRQVVRAGEALGDARLAPEEELRLRFGLVKKAGAALRRGARIAGRAEARGLFEGLVATLDGSAYRSDEASAVVHDDDPSLELFATRTLADGSTESVYLLVGDLPARGSVALEGARVSGNVRRAPQGDYRQQQTWTLVPGSGTLLVDTLRTEPPRVAVRFSARFAHETLGELALDDARFVLTNDERIVVRFDSAY